MPLLTDALVRWQHAAGPFWPYVCAAPFLGTGDTGVLLQGIERRGHDGTVAAHWPRRQRALADALLGECPSPPAPLSRKRERGGRDASEAERSQLHEGRGAGREGADGLPLLMLDLPPEPILAVAPLLTMRGWYVVPVIQRWLAAPAVLPCRRLLRLLVDGAWRVRRPASPRGVLLVADGVRTGPRGYPPLARGAAFDNRYEYQICRFPPPAFLQAHGITRGRWLTATGSPVAAPDLAPYLEGLLQAGLSIDVRPWTPPT